MKKRKIIALSISFLFVGLIVYYFYPEKQLKDGQKADKIVVNKADHKLLLYYKKELIASYSVSLSKKGLGKRTIAGDNLTPEGTFKGKKGLATKFHKAIGIGKWEVCCGLRIHGQKFGFSHAHGSNIFEILIVETLLINTSTFKTSAALLM